jgi:hypothetical protein
LYKQHELRFEFTNKKSSFDGSGNNKISISNIKSTVSLNSIVAGRLGATAEISLFGLGLKRMSDLSGRAQGIITDDQQIDVEIYADESLVFSGGMTASIANMNEAPESSLMISATANANLQSMTASPFTAQGSQNITDVISSICTAAGYEVAFKGMKGMTTSGSPHFEGSVFDQLNRVCSDYGISMSVTPPKKVEFWPSSEQRDEVMPFISRDYGLVGYPIFSSGGMMFQTQYSSLLSIGRYINIETDLPWASGVYQLSTVRHELSSWMPGGSWHSICIANRTKKERAEAQKTNG